MPARNDSRKISVNEAKATSISTGPEQHSRDLRVLLHGAFDRKLLGFGERLGQNRSRKHH